MTHVDVISKFTSGSQHRQRFYRRSRGNTAGIACLKMSVGGDIERVIFAARSRGECRWWWSPSRTRVRACKTSSCAFWKRVDPRCRRMFLERVTIVERVPRYVQRVNAILWAKRLSRNVRLSFSDSRSLFSGRVLRDVCVSPDARTNVTRLAANQDLSSTVHREATIRCRVDNPAWRVG